MPRQNIIVVAVLVILFILFRNPSTNPEPKITTPNHNLVIEKSAGEQIGLQVEIMTSDLGRAQGLSGRPGLGLGKGMIFIFDQPDYHPFWMKEMNFPIDIIWIGENWQIVDITPNVLPSTYPETISPRTPARYVLEVNSGFATKYGVSRGQKVILTRKK